MVQRPSSTEGRATLMSSSQQKVQDVPSVLDSFWKAMENDQRSSGDEDHDDGSYQSDRRDGGDTHSRRRPLPSSARDHDKSSARRRGSGKGRFSIKNRKPKARLESREASASTQRRGQHNKPNSLADALSDDETEFASVYTGKMDQNEGEAGDGILGWFGFGTNDDRNDRDADSAYASDYASSFGGSSDSQSSTSDGPYEDDLSFGSSESYSEDSCSEDDIQSRSKRAGFLPHGFQCRSTKNNNPFRQQRDTINYETTALNPLPNEDSKASSYSELLYTRRRSEGKDRGQFLSRFTDKHANSGGQAPFSNTLEKQFSLKHAMRTQSFPENIGSSASGGGRSTPTTSIQSKHNSTTTNKDEKSVSLDQIADTFGDFGIEAALGAIGAATATLGGAAGTATTVVSSEDAALSSKTTTPSSGIEPTRSRSFGIKKNSGKSVAVDQPKGKVPSTPDRSGAAKLLFCRKPSSPESDSAENKLEKYTRKKEISENAVVDKTTKKSGRTEPSPKSRVGPRAFVKRAICRSFKQPFDTDNDDNSGNTNNGKNPNGPDVMVKMVPDFDDTVIPGSGTSVIPVDGKGGSGSVANGVDGSSGSLTDYNIGPTMMLPEDELSALKGPQSMLIYENDVCNHMDIAYDTLQAENSHSAVQMRKHNMPPIAQPKSAEVIIQVEASTISYHDCIIRRGQWWRNSQVPLPYIPGGDIVGKIHHLDPKVSSKIKIYPGDRVLSFIRWGGNARYARVLAEDLVPVPSTVDAAAATCLVGSYLSAFQSLHIGQKNATRYKKASLKNKRIMVVGAMTCTGKAAVELATAGGAQTIFTTSKKKHQAHLRSLGARTLDRKPDDLQELTGGNIDLILVTDGRDIGLLKLFDCLSVSGHIVFIGRRASDEQYQSSVFVDPEKMSQVMSRTHVFDVFEAWERNKKNCKRDLKFLIQLLDKKVVKPFVLDRIPLDRVGRAHDMLEQKRFPGYLVCEPWVKEKHRAAFL